jgi:hypothetical protein
LIKNYERDRFNISEQDAGGKPYALFLIPLGYSGLDGIEAGASFCFDAYS